MKQPLTHVVLENYKSIKRLEIDLQPNLNIIIGKNGTGKTAFMQKLFAIARGTTLIISMNRESAWSKRSQIKEFRNAFDKVIASYGKIDKRLLILIEHPEAHLHPHAVFDMIMYIRHLSEDHQVVLTTHCPQVIDMLYLEELEGLYICTLDKERGTQLRQLTAEQVASASVYIENTASLSAMWLHTNLLEVINQE